MKVKGGNMEKSANRLNEIEIHLANLEKTMDEMNDELLRQSRIIDTLVKQNKMLIEAVKDNPVKPLSEETPPPHY